MLTPKENYLMTLRGEVPQWVPTYTYNVKPGTEKTTPNAMLEPGIVSPHNKPGGGVDLWGVNYVPVYDAGGAALPEPNNFILDDIRRWRDVIRAPDFSCVDWEQVSKNDIERAGIDRNNTAVALGLHFGYFQLLMSFMGFTNGLCAMYEEPEEVKALFDYLCTFFCGVAVDCIDYYKPEVYNMADDTAAWASPFISMDMYKELLYPYYDRQAKIARDRGLPITFHNCGKCQSFMDEVRGIGVQMWDPAQTCNDLDGFKRKYGNSYVIAGGWDARDELLSDACTDEELYESVSETIKRLGKGGGYVWCGGFLGKADDQRIKHKNEVIARAVAEVGGKMYI